MTAMRFMFSTLSLFMMTSSTAIAADPDVAEGAREFSVSCAACHGMSGTGDGDMAKYLTIKPADLTQLSKKHNGNFPFRDVFQTIDGRSVEKAHGSGPMPIWGDRYTTTSGAAGAEPYRTWSAEIFVRARILELTYYIQSIQK